MLSRFSRVQLFVTPWTVAHQTPLSMGFSRQEPWSGSSCPPPGDLPDPAIEPASLMSPALAGRFLNHYCHLGNTHNGLKVKESESESHSVVSDSLRPQDYTVHGILQARILEWVVMPSSRGSSRPRDQTHDSYVSCTDRRGSLPPAPSGAHTQI